MSADATQGAFDMMISRVQPNAEGIVSHKLGKNCEICDIQNLCGRAEAGPRRQERDCGALPRPPHGENSKRNEGRERESQERNVHQRQPKMSVCSSNRGRRLVRDEKIRADQPLEKVKERVEGTSEGRYLSGLREGTR